jgi:hypothetical protein
MRHTRYALAAMMLAAPTLLAQRIDSFGPEMRPFVGAYVPISDQRNDFKTATMVGAQAAFEVNENFHAVWSVGWTHGHNKFNLGTTDNTHIWQYDLGVELNAFNEVTPNWFFRPFVGLGAGGRTYDYRAVGLKTRTCTAGYGSLGSELQSGAIALRVEARDYVTCYRSPLSSKWQTRTDAAFMVGLAYHLR